MARRVLALAFGLAAVAAHVTARAAAEGRSDGGADGWTPPALNNATVLAALRRPVLTPPAEVDPSDPYQRDWPTDALHTPAGTVCGVRIARGCATYELRTFAGAAGAADAEAAGFHVTHAGGCGTCSSLEDLAAYIEYHDMTTPVRACAIQDIAGEMAAGIDCLRELGMTLACAHTWRANSRNTRENCLDVCMQALLEQWPNNNPDGSLNACLQCDEDESGPIFKVEAGRTRRGSGLASAIERTATEMARLRHGYWEECDPGRLFGDGDDAKGGVKKEKSKTEKSKREKSKKGKKKKKSKKSKKLSKKQVKKLCKRAKSKKACKAGDARKHCAFSKRKGCEPTK